MLRLETTKAAAFSAVFSPADTTLLQAKQPAEGVAVIGIFARVDLDAEWAQVGEWKLAEQPIFMCAKFPFVKLRVTGHIEGQPLKIWCSTPKPEPKAPETPAPIYAEPINAAAAAGHLDSAGIPDHRVSPLVQQQAEAVTAEAAGLPVTEAYPTDSKD